jgi:hypothetical protein
VRSFAAALVFLFVFLSALVAIASPTFDIRLPPGTRTNSEGQLVSTRGLRDTTDVIAKDLDRRGIVVKRVGPYRIRGVELTRFISQTPSTQWLAIHVLRLSGKTLIFFVPRAALDEPPRAR